MSLGVNFHNGDAGKSITGTTGYVLHFRAEKRKGVFRGFAAADFQMASGTASIGTDEPAFKLYGGGFLAGTNVFLFTEGRFQVFLGGNGAFTWHMLKLATPPTGVEANTESLSFGYEARAGVDMRLGSVDGNAFRIETVYSAINSTLAGISSFQLKGIKFQLGIVY